MIEQIWKGCLRRKLDWSATCGSSVAWFLQLPEQSTDLQTLTKESPRARAATPGKPATSSTSGKRHRFSITQPSAFISTTSTWPTISPPSSVPSRTRCAFSILSNHALNLRLTSCLSGQLLLLLQNWRMPSRRPLLAQTCQALILANHPPPQPLPEPRIRSQGQHEPPTTAEPL